MTRASKLRGLPASGRLLIAVTKAGSADWAALKPPLLAAIMQHFVSGNPVLTAEPAPGTSEIESQITELIGYVAGGILALCYLPQVWKTWSTKDATDVSMIMLLKSRRSWSRPLRPTQRIFTVLPSLTRERTIRRASRTMEVLKPPQRPRSAVATRISASGDTSAGA